jgi:hypothetical protein
MPVKSRLSSSRQLPKANSHARRQPNAKLRKREYLTEAEVAQLIEAAKANRWGHRDATMVLVRLDESGLALGSAKSSLVGTASAFVLTRSVCLALVRRSSAEYTRPS